ncbi:3-hydroxyacyl-CoA dehydrogenase NAD-binding domain-containing protein [Edaphosphingomonas haloaromaticamans]|uniref:Fatty acid oxidation complex subunit alpha n=1 Tax=Edaphosphingomonas haloaromaticamans TaxID=653954 RepID=A0A1S1H968_9SPHN|nr:3-hydroxyacyl-CoA dehydrogenase NAD-binding domain-containing protein [Sphingomonas haloaromaticamans]OHT18186.1 Fatty acid oxidation complex subunit alpha [Sphingomonas haloaromaticamans]
MTIITTERAGDVLVVISNNPPVNALGHAVRDGLAKAIDAAAADPAIKAVVIRCEGRTFFAGADITEFGKPMKDPQLPELLERIEALDKPVVAAIHGTALGGGLETALACHYRVAVPSAKLGLPEVKLGILPGAGGTQRLPRVVGAEAALEMIVGGAPIGAKKAAEVGLVDRLAAEDNLAAEAIAFAREVADKRPLPRTSERKAVAEPGVFEAFRAKNAKKMKGFEAPEACIEAIQAAIDLPFREGLEVERRLIAKLIVSDQSKAQRHIFFAERAAAKVDGLPADTPLIPVKSVGVIGAGTMGGGIAMNFLSIGVPVTILEAEQAALDRGVGVIAKNYANNVKSGRMTEAQVEKAMALLKPTLSYDDLAQADLVIEAVFENMDVKKEVFARLDKAAKPGAILATNTSYLDVDEIASVTARPEYVLGMHFFSPANVMKLLEVVRGAKTSDSVLATAMALAKQIRKIAVVAGVCHGFIGNRMLKPRQDQAGQLILEGAKPSDVDRVFLDFGFPMGPFQLADLAGLDIGWHRDPTRRETVREALCAEGRLGQKSGGGFYDYDEKRQRTPSPVAERIIAEFAAAKGIPQRQISDEEIRERCLYTMVNEGAKILEEGKAQRASDIDVVWVYGYGWPVYRGGPMLWADQIGLKTVVDGLKRQADRLGPDFSLSPLLVAKAEKGETFN